MSELFWQQVATCTKCSGTGVYNDYSDYGDQACDACDRGFVLVGERQTAVPESLDADAEHERLLRWRGVEDPCARCSGAGTRVYHSTATWRGGMGGCMMTSDVCDTCWGSGDRYRSGCDLRRLRDEESARVAREAVDAVARSVGATMQSTHGAIAQIVLELEKIAARRGAPRAAHLPELATGLARLLRSAIGAERP